MIEKPCFGEVDGVFTIEPCCVPKCAVPAWDTCEFGKLHPFYRNWQLMTKQAERVWYNGEPPKPWRNEWFIALTTYGDRVVLTALPEEYTYDYRTADDTYILASRIKCWMPFPDSKYIAPEQPAAGPWVYGTPTKEGKYLALWSDESWGGAYWFGGEWMWDGRLSTSLDPIAFAEINLPGGEKCSTDIV